MGRGVAPPTFLALVLLALAALPIAGAESGEEPWDTTGPTVAGIAVDPTPVVPELVRVTGIATDSESNVTFAEFWIDTIGADGTSFFRMRPEDGAFNSATEGLVWIGAYFTFTQGIAPGRHELKVHAIDLAGNWGAYTSLPFFVGDPATTGPFVTGLTATPTRVPRGASLAVEALASDPFNRAVVAAEFFVDRQGPDGDGIPLTARDGAWGDPRELVRGTSVVSLPPGRHVVYVHGRNDRLVWGPPATATITVEAPVLTVEILAEPQDVRPGEVVTHSVIVRNAGNAVATEAWIDVSLPSPLAYMDDTAAANGGARIGPDRWRFTNVSAPWVEFTIRSQVRNDATDGLEVVAEATLDYTNELGWDFAAVRANAIGALVAPELQLTVTAPPVAYAAETFDLAIEIDHSGIRTIPVVDVAVDLGSWAVPHGDNAADLGGESLGSGLWRFADLAPGLHRFVLTVRVASDVMDVAIAPIGVTVQYTSRSGLPVAILEMPSLRLSRPSLDITTHVDRENVVAGDRVTFVIDYVNRGSASAKDVEFAFTLPEGMELAGGDTPTASQGSVRRWRFFDIASEETGRVTVVLLSGRELTAELVFELTYTSPNGVSLGHVTASETIVVRRAPLPQPPPIAAMALAGTSALLVGLVATERGKTAFLFLLFLPLYTRLRHEKVLDHETRGMIRGYIVANPGDHYNSIKGALDLPNGTLAYHIQVLQKEMIVRSVKDGKFRRFYPAEMRVPEGGEPTKIQKVILDLIRANPGITPRDAAGLLGLTSSTVSYHLEKLAELERVEFRREGISKRLYVRGDLEIP